MKKWSLAATGYDVATTLAAPVVLSALATRSRGRTRWSERMGTWPHVPGTPWWFHGASVGEVQGLLPLLKYVRSERLGSTLLTCTSPTGLERGAHSADHLRMLPLDAPWCIRSALECVKPGRFVVTETELWPNLFEALLEQGVPCSVVNGRISDYTVRWYTLLKALFAPLVCRFHVVCVSSEDQSQRFRALGVRPEQIRVTGHTKYDTSPSITGEEERILLRTAYFPHAHRDAPIIVLGSVRPGEETHWLSACMEQWAAGKRVKLLVAPRHAEKFEYFAAAVERLGRPWARWSDPESVIAGDHDILILDTMGRLEGAYSIANLAFVGATLVDIGGHNPLEPAMYGAPVCVGPFVRNISELVGEMRERGGVFTIQSPESIRALVARVAERDPTLAAAGHQGRLVWERHRGATSRVMEALMEDTR